jgi:hypothetical protein
VGGGLSSADALLVGCLIALAGYGLMGGQLVVEQALLEGKARKLTAMQMNAVEGVWGALLCMGVLGVYQAISGPTAGPWSDHGHVENTAHTLCCLRTTPPLLGLALSLIPAAGLFSASAYVLADVAGPVFRAFIMVSRGILTWLADLAIFYVARSAAGGGASDDGLGEAWSRFSLLQLAGFLLILGGEMARVRLRAQDAAAAEAAEAAAGGPAGLQDAAGSRTQPGGARGGRTKRTTRTSLTSVKSLRLGDPAHGYGGEVSLRQDDDEEA